jgi:hypothetical protein
VSLSASQTESFLVNIKLMSVKVWCVSGN